MSMGYICERVLELISFRCLKKRLSNIDTTIHRAVVVGAAGGIGLAVCKGFLDSGVKVVAVARGEDNKNVLLRELGTDINVIDFDIRNIEKIRELIEDCTNGFDEGEFDIWVNCAGVFLERDWERDFLNFTREEYEAEMLCNIEAPFFICQGVIEYYLKNSIKGHILNIASTAGIKDAYLPYGLSKGGIIKLTRGLGKKFASSGIVINGIAPGPTAMRMMKVGIETDAENFPESPLERMLHPEEIAELVLYMTSDYAKAIVGEVVVIDGGESVNTDM